MAGKNIVVCCDGTGNEYGRNNTNIVGTFSAVVRDVDQLAFYDPGVGTFDAWGHTVGKLAKKAGILWGQAFGTGLEQNVEDAYEYLMSRFEPDDKLFIFGFSRGAFTARALAGMLHKCGLLQKGSRNLIPYATKINFALDNGDVAEGFKNTYCHVCRPHFIGVWDTVASLGHIVPAKSFKDNVLNPDVSNGYHAVAIDEKRKKFPVSLWDESAKATRQTIEQVWFAGVHSDVGGWYDEKGLSDIALIWMLEKAEKKGLRLREGWKDNLKPDPLGPLHESRTGFWKAWRPAHRQIPEGAQIHQSAIDRARGSDYDPKFPQKIIPAP